MADCIECGHVLTVAKGLCRNCYMRQARRKTPRLTEEALLKTKAEWEPKIRAGIGAATDRGCREWTGTRTKQGYGMVSIGMHSYPAHRLVYLLEKGLPDGPVLRHQCDNPACCNPGHLLPGTYAENMRDARERGRISDGGKGRPKPASGNYKRVYSTPWGEFASAPKAAAACPVRIHHRALARRYLAGTLADWYAAQLSG
jgi:hypothetical protein